MFLVCTSLSVSSLTDLVPIDQLEGLVRRGEEDVFNMVSQSAQEKQWLGRFLGMIIGWDPSLCKSNRLHVVDILRFFFIDLRYIPQILLKWSAILLKSPTSTGCFSNSTGSSVTNRRFFPDMGFSVAYHGRSQNQTTHQEFHQLQLWQAEI